MRVNQELYSQKALHIFQTALKLAAKMGHGFLGSEHLLWALAKEGGFAGRALENCGLDEKLLEEYVRRYDGGVTRYTPGRSRYPGRRTRCCIRRLLRQGRGTGKR